MAEKKNYTATKDFDYGDMGYLVGETFRKPDDWTVDKNHYEMLAPTRPGQVFTVFSAPYANGYEVINNERKPVIDYRRVILPVS